MRAHDAEELSHYSSGTSDIEYLYPIGWSELEGIANDMAALQAQLASSDSNLSAARAQLTSLQQALTNLQNSQATSNAATAAAMRSI